MKRINIFIILLAILTLTFNPVQSQDAPNRTTNTIIADALAQFPSATAKVFNQTMTPLVNTGEEGLLKLIQMMKAPGAKSNEPVEFAISGWTNFVANDAAKRTVAANAFAKALKMPLDNDIKAFLIRQLELLGSDEQVNALTPFLTDEKLSAPAIQALATINTAKSNAELLSALNNAGNSSEAVKINLINALGKSGYEGAEDVLLKQLQSNPSPRLLEVLYNTMRTVGTVKSVLPLKMAAEQTGYSYQKNNATASYLGLLNKLAGKDSKIVKAQAESLLKQATLLGKQDIRVAAMNLLMKVPDANYSKLLKQTLKDKNKVFVTNALNMYAPYADNKGKNLIVKALKRAGNSGTATPLMYWLGSNLKTESAVQAVIPYLNSSEKEIQIAAVRTLANMGTNTSSGALVSLFKQENNDLVTLVKKQLLTVLADNLSQQLAAVYPQSSESGKSAILEIIGARRFADQYSLVQNQLKEGSPAVKKQAAASLKSVVTDKNLQDIFTLLESGDKQYRPEIQEALNEALSYLPQQEQTKVIQNRMSQSGKNYLYYNSLANVGTTESLSKIVSDYTNLSGENKTAAFDALTHWKTFDGVYSLLDIVRKSQDKTELAKATGALIPKIAGSNKPGEVKSLYLREIMQYAQNDKQRNAILKQLENTDSYKALLFAAPYMDNSALKETAAQTVMNLTLNNPSFLDKTTSAILDKVSNTLSNPDAGYQREAIKKYLNENKVQNDFVPIFNGKDLTGWKGLVGNPITRAKMTGKELQKAQKEADAKAKESWVVENGELVFTGKGDNLCTEKQYSDFEMLVDWKLYPGPEPDAGIYLRGTPQVQIWDTARVKVGAQVGSGGLYNNKVNPSKPLKVADEKVGEWNNFRIKMIGDRVSVWLNGELVVENVIMENYWDRNQPIPAMEQIELQAHGSKVAYRDILIREIPRPESFKLSKQEEKEGFKILFDGTNMHQWQGNTIDYQLEDGNIVIRPNSKFKGSTRNLYTKNEYDNFVFRFEFQLTPGANNGLGIRTPLEGDAAYVGMELQILDNDAPIYEKLQVYQYHGSVYGVIPAKRGFLKPVGEWNYEEVIADGDNIKVILNGNVIVDGNIREAAKNGTADHKDHPGLFNKKGYIGFLGHGSVVKFRNIRIKEL
ncbi:MAG: DUF1080 domain-containing protein [Bacteroidales bacterium]|nr:DUF1080 domain-containing protein [Bacteroidales bacterium]